MTRTGPGRHDSSKTRRDLLLALGATLVCAPFRAPGQQQERPRKIGILVPIRRQEATERMASLEHGLRELGRVDGKNLRVEWRFADGQYERLFDLAKELVALGVEVLVCLGGTPAALAAQKATKTVPIVFVNVGDPVRVGLVDGLAHPGRNATGLANLIDVIAVKHLEMLRSFVPRLSRVAALENPSNPNVSWAREKLKVACSTTRTKLSFFHARTPTEISDAFSLMAADLPGALLVSADSFIDQQRSQIAKGAAALRLPSIGHHVAYAEAGGLASYGSNPAESYHRAASYVDRILKGAKPQDLPVEQPTMLQLVINRKTAKALGLAIPQDLLLLAARVIE
jgi:putative tryptophan/tyrosine transport system substrate-binding protein